MIVGGCRPRAGGVQALAAPVPDTPRTASPVTACPASIVLVSPMPLRPSSPDHTPRLLAGVLVLLLLLVIVGAYLPLYHTALEQRRAALLVEVAGKAALIEAVGRFDTRHSDADVPGGAAAATLAQVREAARRFHAGGHGIEMVLGRSAGGRIEFLLDPPGGGPPPAPLALDSPLALPMRLALQGQHGSLIGPDYAGTRVLAAHAPLAQLNWGLVVKVALSELRRPYLRMAGYCALLAAAVMALGWWLIWRISAPLVARLGESEQRLRQFLDHVPAGVVVHRADTSIDYANPVAAQLLGLDLEQLHGRRAVDPGWHFLHEDGSRMPLAAFPVMQVVASRQPLRDYVTGVVTAAQVAPRWLLVNAFPLPSATGALAWIIVTFIDVSERQRLVEALAREARTDPLTGLCNRRHFRLQAEAELARARRSAAPLAVLAMDLDHFKRINDRHGHVTGDRVLVEVARICRRVLRPYDLPCRLGGEEFAVLMPGTDACQALGVAERLRSAMAAAQLSDAVGAPVHWTLSLGVAVADPGEPGLDALLSRADAALYRAKRGGRNRVKLADAPGQG